MIDTNKIISTNLFQGFQNYTSVIFSTVYAGGSIGAGVAVGPERASTSLNNSNAISIVEVQLAGLDSFTRLLPGFIAIDFPSIAAVSYQIEILSYYSGGSLVCDAYISNQTGGSVSVPAITFNYTAKLYQAPF